MANNTLLDANGKPIEATDIRPLMKPQQACLGTVCWCGAHPEGKPRPPKGMRSFSKERTKRWLAEREAARG